MALGINLIPLDLDKNSYIEKNPQKILEFTEGLSKADTVHASSRLLDSLKAMNRQPLDADTRISILELYRKITLELSSNLEDTYANAPVPLTNGAKTQAAMAEALWLETSYGYKRALIDIKQKLVNFNASKLNALVILRAIEALKNEAYVNYLCYSFPSEALWSDLHKLYYHALQLSVEEIEIEEQTASNCKTVNSVYSQALLMYLANPQRLSKPSIRKLSQYLASLSKHAQLRGMGFVEKPIGIFLIELDSGKPPVAYLKNYNIPNVETDILLVTVDVARHIHHQLQYIQQHQFVAGSIMPTMALEVLDEDLLTHLIKNFGATPFRGYSRIEKNQAATIAIGFDAANIIFRDQKRLKQETYSSWDVMNISPTGFALKTAKISELSLGIGEVVSIQENATTGWALGSIIWINTKNQHSEEEYVEIGVKLISPNAKSITIKSKDSNKAHNALLLPEIKAIHQPASIITLRDYLKSKSTVEYNLSNKKFKLVVKQLLEVHADFERFEISLIHSDLS